MGKKFIKIVLYQPGSQKESFICSVRPSWNELLKASTKEEGKNKKAIRHEVDDIKSLMEFMLIKNKRF